MDRQVRSSAPLLVEVPMVAAEVVGQMGRLAELGWGAKRIAREGWPYLTASLVVAVAVTWFFGWWSIPFWIVYFFILQFFRDPPREIPQGEGLVLCPADGRVIVVGDARDPYRNADGRRDST